MQTYDFIMLFILGGLTIYGYSKGMAWQIAYLTSFIASYFVAAKFSTQLAPLFGDAAPWNKFVAMAAIYAGCSLAVWMIFRVVRGAIDKVRLESFDHQMGAVIGAARGVLWCVGVTFFAVTLLPDATKPQIIGSRSGYYIAKLLDKADSVVPPELHQMIGPHLERLENELNQSQGYPPGQGFPQAPTNGFGGGQNFPSQNPQGGFGQNSFGQNGAGQGGWPAGQQPQPPQQTNQPWPNNPNAWPQPPANNRTPAQPAGWPQQPTNNWP